MVLTAFCLLTAVLATNAAAAPISKPRPTTEKTGAFAVTDARWKVVEGVSCATTNGKAWRSGKFAGRKFLTDEQRGRNLAAMARAAKAPKSAATLRKRAKQSRATDLARRLPCTMLRGSYIAREVKRAVDGTACGTYPGRPSTGYQPGEVVGPYFTPLSSFAIDLRLRAKYVRAAEAKRLRAAAAKYGARNRAAIPVCTALVPQTGPINLIPAVSPLRFDLSGGTALALRDGSSWFGGTTGVMSGGIAYENRPTGSNLSVTTATGALRDTVVNGSAYVTRILDVHAGSLYLETAGVVLENTAMRDESRYCTLVQVTIATGVPSCFDAKAVGQLGLNSTETQLWHDNAGNVYYLGNPTSSPSRTVLRRAGPSGAADVWSDLATVNDLVVAPDGTVFISASDRNSGTQWTRRVAPNGSIKNLFASSGVGWLSLFPDGDVYMQGAGEVLRYDVSADDFGSVWMGDTGAGATWDYSLCGMNCNTLVDPRRMSSGRIFGAGSGEFHEYFPVPDAHASLVTNPDVLEPVGSWLVAAGNDGLEHNAFSVYDTDAEIEYSLLAPGRDLKVYHAAASTTAGRIYFDALRFSDNRYVLGEVDLATREVSYRAELSARLSDLQALDG